MCFSFSSFCHCFWFFLVCKHSIFLKILFETCFSFFRLISSYFDSFTVFFFLLMKVSMISFTLFKSVKKRLISSFSSEQWKKKFLATSSQLKSVKVLVQDASSNSTSEIVKPDMKTACQFDLQKIMQVMKWHVDKQDTSDLKLIFTLKNRNTLILQSRNEYRFQTFTCNHCQKAHDSFFDYIINLTFNSSEILDFRACANYLWEDQTEHCSFHVLNLFFCCLKILLTFSKIQKIHESWNFQKFKYLSVSNFLQLKKIFDWKIIESFNKKTSYFVLNKFFIILVNLLIIN